MRTLFFKIFLWFWLAVASVFVTLLLVTWFTETEPLAARWREVMGDTLKVLAPATAQIYERQGVTGLRGYLAALEQETRARCYFFDAAGRELTGRQTPPHFQALAQQSLTSAEPVIARQRPFPAGQRALGPDGQPGYALVVEMPLELFSPLRLGAGKQLLRVLALLLAGSLVCYGLARYLSAPVRQLRDATQRLARGDLAARVGPLLGARRDELTDLGHDFDRMAERLQSLITAQTRLLGDISHELRSPLARLNVALELARQRAGPEAETSLNRIERESGRLNELISQTLTLARLESDDGAWQRHRVDLAALISEVAADADFEARSHNRRVQCAVSAPCVIAGAPELLRRAVENVARNAVRHTPAGTEVLITMELVKDEAVITVLDAGEGVPEEELGELFRPFYRVGTARERNSGGVGLGLAITERAVRLHGGHVTAGNTEGGGLKVTIVLPRSKA